MSGRWTEFLARARAVPAAALMSSILAGPGLAQGSMQPAELPPETYAGLQYVDSKGCAFLRAGTEAETIWVPRVTSGGAQICDFPPSGNRVPIVGEDGAANAAEAGAEADVAPETAPVVAAEPQEENGSFFVAIGSFGFASNVDKAVAGAKALGYPVSKGKLKGGEQSLVTVFAGPFDNRSSANAARDKLRKAGFADAVVMKN